MKETEGAEVMKLKEYINSTFPGLVLKPSLYYQWDKSIRFEFAKGLYQMKEETDELNHSYFHTVYNQATSLFHDLVSVEDKLLFVTKIHRYKNYRRRSKKKISVYHHYIKSKDVCFSLKQETLPYMFKEEEEADDFCTSQFTLECRKQDISYPSLIKAICNQDFPSLKPRLSNRYYRYDPDIFFINVTKSIILYIFDDRGCEVIARDIETLRPIYYKYRDLVDECCLEKVEKQFK